MCCTFGDSADVEWWRGHQLPLVEMVGRDGRIRPEIEGMGGLSLADAREHMVRMLAQEQVLTGREPTRQTVRVHERCDTPVEYLVADQWFVKVLDFKEELLDMGDKIQWHPPHMHDVYKQWVENLKWDWCISRQRYYGVPIPVWYCDACGHPVIAEEAQLPVDPQQQRPRAACACGSERFTPEEDVLDTWATSSLTPQIAGGFQRDPGLYEQVFPMTLRPQAHEIIRTWAFYTMVKSYHHFGVPPWTNVAISGWGLAPEGSGKISKSKGGGPISPGEIIDRHSADAVRYWAASTGFGRDSMINEDKILAGHRLTVKLWNVARLSERFFEGYDGNWDDEAVLMPTDRWILSRLQKTVIEATEAFEDYEYSSAKNAVERFFWRDLADNYLEMAKKRLYGDAGQELASRQTLYRLVSTVLKLFAPILPYVTEAIYQELFADQEAVVSIHKAAWPKAAEVLIDDEAELAGEEFVAIATSVRRYKTDNQLPLGSELPTLALATSDTDLGKALQEAQLDIGCVTRAQTVLIQEELPDGFQPLEEEGRAKLAIG